MNQKDSLFRDLTGAVQVKLCELHKQGVGAVVKHAPVVSQDEEDMLWTTNTISDHSPIAL